VDWASGPRSNTYISSSDTSSETEVGKRNPPVRTFESKKQIDQSFLGSRRGSRGDDTE
jgi:hypothetical protein